MLVGASGFEPPTPRSRTECSTRLSHAPTAEKEFYPNLRFSESLFARVADKTEHANRRRQAGRLPYRSRFFSSERLFTNASAACAVRSDCSGVTET